LASQQFDIKYDVSKHSLSEELEALVAHGISRTSPPSLGLQPRASTFSAAPIARRRLPNSSGCAGSGRAAVSTPIFKPHLAACEHNTFPVGRPFKASDTQLEAQDRTRRREGGIGTPSRWIVWLQWAPIAGIFVFMIAPYPISIYPAQADFFVGGQNSINLPRCCGGSHFVLFENLIGI